MRWASALGQHPALAEAFKAAAEQIEEELNGQAPDLLFCFASPSFAAHYQEVPRLAAKHLKPGAFAGCSAGGLIAGGVELEKEPAIALSAALLPDVRIRKFH